MSARFVAFVRWPDVPRWLALGWHYTGPLPAQHGGWSAGLEWRCDCRVRKPVE
jgi:hypothetical protein